MIRYEKWSLISVFLNLFLCYWFPECFCFYVTMPLFFLNRFLSQMNLLNFKTVWILFGIDVKLWFILVVLHKQNQHTYMTENESALSVVKWLIKGTEYYVTQREEWSDLHNFVGFTLLKDKKGRILSECGFMKLWKFMQ